MLSGRGGWGEPHPRGASQPGRPGGQREAGQNQGRGEWHSCRLCAGKNQFRKGMMIIPGLGLNCGSKMTEWENAMAYIKLQ